MEAELCEKIKILRKTGLGITPIARKLNKCTDTIRDYLVLLGELPEIPVQPGGRKRKYHVNDDFFENIDSEIKAYVLGFIYADGCVHDRRNQISIKLKSNDENLLILINKCLKSNFPISRHYNRYSEKYKYTEKSALVITSKKIVNDLYKIGCVSRKSDILTFPNINENYRHHFMRGYFDGDGSVYITNQNEIGFSINSTFEFCDKFLKFLPYDGKSKVTKEKRSNKNVYYIKIGGPNKVKNIYDFLYKNSSIYLKRKKSVFNTYFKKRENKYK